MIRNKDHKHKSTLKELTAIHQHELLVNTNKRSVMPSVAKRRIMMMISGMLHK